MPWEACHRQFKSATCSCLAEARSRARCTNLEDAISHFRRYARTAPSPHEPLERHTPSLCHCFRAETSHYTLREGVHANEAVLVVLGSQMCHWAYPNLCTKDYHTSKVSRQGNNLIFKTDPSFLGLNSCPETPDFFQRACSPFHKWVRSTWNIDRNPQMIGIQIIWMQS